MPTSAATNSRRRDGGFTLVELLVVLALLSLFTFLAVPAFQSLLEGAAQRESTRLTGVIRLLRNEAVLTRRPYRLVVDLKEGEYFVEERDRSGRYNERSDPRLLARYRLPPSMKIKDMIVAGNSRYPLTERQVPLAIDPSGFMDAFSLHFSVGDSEYTLTVSAFTAETSLVSGYVLP